MCGPDLWLHWHGFDTTERKAEIAAFYEDPAGNTAILQKYDVDYIYVSSYERSSYAVDEGALDVQKMIDELYRKADTAWSSRK